MVGRMMSLKLFANVPCATATTFFRRETGSAAFSLARDLLRLRARLDHIPSQRSEGALEHAYGFDL